MGAILYTYQANNGINYYYGVNIMNIIIENTNKSETLVLKDANGVDWINDFIGNWDGFGSSESDTDSKFVKVELLSDEYDDADAYVTSQGNFNWWSAVVSQQSELDELVAKARDIGISGDDINDALDQPQRDLDNLIVAQTQEIGELIELNR